jgi:serine phosphatase RsbU (regulator of sigma subunit)
MNTSLDASLFLKIPLFKELSREDLFSLINELPVESHQAGKYIFHEGEPGNSLFVVKSGKIEVVLAGGTRDEMHLRDCGPGEYVGEMSLILKQGRRTASVRTKEDSQLWMMTRDKFNDCIQRWPHLAYSMVEIMSERLESSNEAAFNDLVRKNQMLQQAYDELKAAQDQLIEKERLERELQVAAEIQLSILPDILPDADEFSFGARILPARQVGGDFYDVFELKDHRIGVLIGDVADKGVPSALFMARAHALIMAEADIGTTPAEVMSLVNKHITRLQKTSQFVTVLYGILDLKTRDFIYARAGHEPPLIVHSDGSVERMSHKPGMAIGLWDPVTLDEQSVKLASGDMLLLYTDGMTDCRNPEGEPFGLDRIKRKLTEYSKFGAQQACNSLLETLQTYQNGAKQDDDVTLVTVKAK